MTLFVPWEPVRPDVELDASWYMVLHWAFLNGLDFGTELIFTYGPWGFIFQGYHPSTFIYTLIGWTLITTVGFIALLRISERASPKWWVQLLWLFGILALTGSTIRGMHDIRIFITCWALLLLHLHVDDRPLTKLKVAMVIALSLISLGKFSLAILAFLVILVISIDLLARRIVPWVAYIYLGGLAVFWLAAGQSPLSVLPFLSNSFKLASGYAEGVGMRSPHGGLTFFLFVLCVLGFIGVVGMAYVQRLREIAQKAKSWKDSWVVLWTVRTVLGVGAMIAALFLVFKIGYVRHDEHELLSTSCLVALGLVYLAIFMPQVRDPLLRRALVVLPAICLPLMWYSFHIWGTDGLARATGETVWKFPGRAIYALRSLVSSSAQRRDYETVLAEQRALRPIPKVDGSVDGYAWIQYSILANGLEYRPRPAMQGYLSYVPEIGRMNSDFLRSTRAPDSVLIDVQDIDGWYPSLVDATSWPELLGRYALKDASTSVLLLERSERPRQQSRVELKQVTAKLGEWIDVPSSNEPIWASIDLKPTVGGKVAQTFYRLPLIHIIVRTGSGELTQGRLIPPIAREGFLLSPLVKDRISLAVLWSEQWREYLQLELVSQFKIVVNDSDTSTYAYNPEFTVKFEELRYEHQDVMSVPGVIDHFRFQQFAQSLASLTGHEKLIGKNEMWRPVMLSPPPARWVMQVPEGVRSIRVTFGMLPDAYKQEPRTAGVDFRLCSVTPLDSEQMRADVIWSRVLKPTDVIEDRGPQTVDIELPNPAPKVILFETVAGRPEAKNLSYWADVVFR